METNIPGLLRTLQLGNTHGLMPLYEAISNANDAIREVANPNPRIDIFFSRVDDLANQNPEHLQPINGFRITDNGIGFSDEHLSAFGKAYTDKKLHIGGKGVGRFTYLKVFHSVEFTSVYLDKDTHKKRSFTFSIDKEVSEDHVEPADSQQTGTVLVVKNILSNYQKSWPLDIENIGKKIITHFLIGFASENMPPIFLHDTNAQSINLKSLFKEIIVPDLKEYSFQIKDHYFSIQILRYPTNRDTHELMFCAHGREVANTKLKTILPELPERFLNSENQSYALKVLISGEYFDDNLNETRTEILFNPDHEDVLEEDSKILRAELNSQIAIKLREILEIDLQTTNNEKLANVTNFVQNIAPEYQILLHEKYKKRIEQQVPPNCTNEKLDEHLLHIKRDIEDEVKKEEKEITKIIDEGTYDQYKEKVNDLFEKLNDVGKANLARYVTHRRAVIDLLEHSLQKRKIDDKYPLEEVIHKMIFPMRVRSKDVFLEQQNLWMLDERLNYHTLLISDKKISSIKGLEGISQKEPDLLAVFFDNPVVVSEATENSGAVVVIEFKRPGRDDYQHDPTQQITDRFVEISDGGVRDIDGRVVNPRNLRYFGYLIADLTPSLKKQIRTLYTESVDGEGFFRTLPNGMGYVEIVSYDKMINDAKRRNRILFDKLGLHKN